MNIDIVNIIIIFITIIISMTLHEAMHAYASYWLGDHTAKASGRLTLNPIAHIDPFMTLFLPLMLAIVGAPVFGAAKPVPFNPYGLKWGEWGVAVVAIAGPLTNLFLAFMMFGIWAILGTPESGILAQSLIAGVSVNLGFFVFNMIPIPPLDGSRIMYVLAPDFIRKAMNAMEQFGILLVFILIFIAGDSFGLFLMTVIRFFFELFGHIFIF